MPRPPVAKEDDELKPFRVKEGFTIGGFDGQRKDKGGIIMLSKAQAEYFQALGAITFDMGAIFDDTNSETNIPEVSPEPEADGQGELDLGTPPEPEPVQKTGAGARRR